jgi:LCP family protein required for cell wall assembly
MNKQKKNAQNNLNGSGQNPAEKNDQSAGSQAPDGSAANPASTISPDGKYIQVTDTDGTTHVYARVKSRAPKKTKGRLALRVFLSIVSVLLVAALVIGATLWQIVSKNIKTFDPKTKLDEKYDVPADQLSNPLPSVKGITNILLLGVDNRDASTTSVEDRSDTMIIMTIDSVHNQIKLTSLQRDIMVYFPGDNTPKKINAANALGGPLLAMRVVNDTFRLNIDKFVLVNMAGLEQIIDAAGGVTVDITPKMLKALNAELAMINKTYKNTEPSPALTKTGVQLLNGRQAVVYARIRKIDDDYARMERQREVIQEIFKSAMKASLSQKYKLMQVGLSNITTNMSVGELAAIGVRSVFMINKPIAQLQIPIEGYYKNVSTDVWKSLCDYNGMIPLVQQFIFEKTFPFDPVKKIKGAPNS